VPGFIELVELIGLIEFIEFIELIGLIAFIEVIWLIFDSSRLKAESSKFEAQSYLSH